MHKADLAELLLGLVTTRERAVSVVGDLLEESQARGTGQFWFLVARTTVRQAGRDMAAAPFGMAGAAVRGWFVGLRVFLVAFAVLMLPVSLVLVLGFHIDVYNNGTLSLLGKFVNELVVPFQIGRWMARRYAGREVAGCFSLVTLESAITICMVLVGWEAGRSGALAHWGLSPSGFPALTLANVFRDLASEVFWGALGLVPLLAGAAFARARILQASSRTI